MKRLSIILLCALCGTGFMRVAVPKLYKTFNIYSGGASRSYTNRFSVSLLINTNYSVTLSNQPNGKRFYGISQSDALGLETDYSNEVVRSNTFQTLTWHTVSESQPVTNVITMSCGTNSLIVTNPIGKQFWRLRGRSWTSSELQASDNLKGPWVILTIWSYPSNRTPNLSISQTNL